MSRYSLVLLALIGAVLLATSQVTAQSFQHDFQFCIGDFALCAASTFLSRSGHISGFTTI